MHTKLRRRRRSTTKHGGDGGPNTEKKRSKIDIHNWIESFKFWGNTEETEYDQTRRISSSDLGKGTTEKFRSRRFETSDGVTRVSFRWHDLRNVSHYIFFQGLNMLSVLLFNVKSMIKCSRLNPKSINP